MGLTSYDFDSPTWKAIKAHFTERRDFLRKMNDAPMSESDRGQLIGRIQEVKALLAMEEQAPLVE